MAHLRVLVGWATLLFTAWACANRSPHDSAHPSPGDRNLLTQAELLKHDFSTVYEAIEALRSHWLRERGPDSFSAPGHVQVYLDDSRLGGVEALRNLSLANVVYIRHIDGVDAAARWGLDHGNGVILVATHP